MGIPKCETMYRNRVKGIFIAIISVTVYLYILNVLKKTLFTGNVPLRSHIHFWVFDLI